MLTQAYGPHPLLRAASPYVPVGPYYGGGPPPTQPLPVPQLSGGYPNAPPGVPQGPPSGGYTLPPTAAYFPVTAYTNNTTQNACVDNTQQVMMSQDSLNLQQPNTPDLLMHRRAVSLHKGPNWAVGVCNAERCRFPFGQCCQQGKCLLSAVLSFENFLIKILNQDDVK